MQGKHVKRRRAQPNIPSQHTKQSAPGARVPKLAPPANATTVLEVCNTHVQPNDTEIGPPCSPVYLSQRTMLTEQMKPEQRVSHEA